MKRRNFLKGMLAASMFTITGFGWDDRKTCTSDAEQIRNYRSIHAPIGFTRDEITRIALAVRGVTKVCVSQPALGEVLVEVDRNAAAVLAALEPYRPIAVIVTVKQARIFGTIESVTLNSKTYPVATWKNSGLQPQNIPRGEWNA